MGHYFLDTQYIDVFCAKFVLRPNMCCNNYDIINPLKLTLKLISIIPQYSNLITIPSINFKVSIDLILTKIKENGNPTGKQENPCNSNQLERKPWLKPSNYTQYLILRTKNCTKRILFFL